MKIRFLLLAAVMTIFCATHASAVSLEQVQPVMPQIDVFVRDGDTDLKTLQTEDVIATLDGTPLKTELLEPSSQGVFYVFMMDISTSISEAHIAAAREAVMNTYRQMGPDDQLALISFGSKVNLLLQGGESASEVEAALDTVHSTDNNTRFYDAMNTLVETASAQSNMRRVAVVVSDGEDDVDAGMTREELESILRRSGVAVYALAVDSASEETISSFSQFIRVSGGDLFTFSPDNADEQLAALQESIDEIWHLQFTAPSNVVDGENHELVIQFGQLDTLSVDICPTQWIPDDKAPYLVSVAPDTITDTVTLTFNESMSDLNNPANFVLKDASGSTVPFTITSVEPSCVVLQCSSLDNPAGWTLEIKPLTDASMENNAMASCTVLLAEVEEEPSVEAPPVPEGNITGEIMKLILIAGGIVLVAVIVAVVLLFSRRQSSTPKQAPEKKIKEKTSTAKNLTGATFFFQSDDQNKK